MNRDGKDRLKALQQLLNDGGMSTQEELREKLEKQNFDVTQSTVSRDLRKLGAVRAVDTEGRTVYRLADEFEAPFSSTGLGELVREVTSNGAMIIIHTAVGSASLIARHLDNFNPGGILGTIAGDDTVFVAPPATGAKEVKTTIRAIYSCLNLE